MKAIEITAPGKIRIIGKDKPQPKDGEALLQVLYGGICGADVASYTGNQPFTTYPRIPGHELSARIVSVPENDRGLQEGDIVTCNPYFNCGTCYACRRGLVNACHDNQTMGVQRDGGFQEYITMPVGRIIDGKGLSAKELALIEPFSISCHALSRAAVKAGDNLLIMGAGPIGLFALLRAKALGARVLIADMLESRLALAEDLRPKMLEDHLDAKSRLQEIMQRTGDMPTYEFISMEGPPHAPQFRYSVVLEDRVLGTGQGTSKQHAQQAAARDALRKLGSK